MTYQHILYEKREHIASLTVNRPPLNVLNRLTLDELEQALLAARDDPEVAAVILTGSGEKAFVAGADIAEIQTFVSEGPLSGREKFARRGQRLVTAIERLGKPVIRRRQRLRPRWRLRDRRGGPSGHRLRECQVRPTRGESRLQSLLGRDTAPP